MSWMDKSIETDVQLAIQSQTIQTAQEANTSKITDAGFQSYLQNAPIPRIAMTYVTNQTPANNTITNVTWGQAARVFDPYTMHPPVTTTVIQVPVSGFYSFNLGLLFAAPATAGLWNMRLWYETVQSKIWGAGVVLARHRAVGPVAGGATNWSIALSMLRPLEQGDTFLINWFQDSGGAITLNDDGGLTGCWVAPLGQYQTAGGN